MIFRSIEFVLLNLNIKQIIQDPKFQQDNTTKTTNHERISINQKSIQSGAS